MIFFYNNKFYKKKREQTKPEQTTKQLNYHNLIDKIKLTKNNPTPLTHPSSYWIKSKGGHYNAGFPYITLL